MIVLWTVHTPCRHFFPNTQHPFLSEQCVCAPLPFLITGVYTPSGDSNTMAGSALAALGDLDGSGVMDLALGTPLYGTSNNGIVFLLFLAPAGDW